MSNAVQFTQLSLQREASETSSESEGTLASGHAVGLTSAEVTELARQFPEAVFREDLLLARACALDREPAWERFFALYREKLFHFAVLIAKDDFIARELADSLYTDLFGIKQDCAGRRISKLDSYSGRGSLDGWLRTIVAQAYVNRYRSQRRFSELDESANGKADTPLESLAQHLSLLTKATDAALAALVEEDRLLLVLLSGWALVGRDWADVAPPRVLHCTPHGKDFKFSP